MPISAFRRRFDEGACAVKALTCNELLTGDVVFWRRGEWVERFAEAEVFEDDAAAAEAETVATAQGGWAGTAPYLIDLKETDEGVVPVSYRERLRALGPTNHPQHGKQADGGADIAALVHATGAARSTGRLSLIKRH